MMKSVKEFKGVFIHRNPVDMRKSINGLSEIVEMAQMGELMGPYLFVFCGRRRDLIKVLYFDSSGFCLWMKRLEKEIFPWPKKLDDEVINITPSQLLKEISDDRDRHLNSRYVNYSQQTREKVHRYFSLISVFRLADILTIPNSTLSSWKLQNLEKAENKTNPIGITSDISKSDLAQKLKNLLKRHDGKVSRRYSQSEKELILQLVDAFGSKIVHEDTRISYDTIARLKRERELHQPKIETALKYAPVIDVMRKYPGMGPMQIRDYVHRHMGLSMGVNSVRKVMEDNGWISSYSRKLRVGEEVRSYESIRRNHLWHVDFKHFFINKCKAYLLFIEDDHSRFITGHAFADGERVETIVEAMQEAINRHGKPELVMSDGGSAFHSWRGQSKFSQFLEDFGIDHYLSKTPRVNGKVESINQKIEKEILDVESYSSVTHLQEKLIQWIWFYNFFAGGSFSFYTESPNL